MFSILLYEELKYYELRKDRELDEFEKYSLKSIRISIHNTRADTPKNDWKLVLKF